ncbi:MAG: LysR family transcriptional regulator [Proteobacteria bacterium]|nr:LysR family transcriptional regulator [Pseudomonadota bacterium]
MRLRQIEVFHAVYSSGSISAAARLLNVSQPAVSKVLRHTETQLGFTLFDLVRGRLMATDDAHALFREVSEVYDRVASLQQAARNLRGSGTGHLRIGVLPSLGLDRIPQAIQRFRLHNPQVTFDLRTIHNSDFLRALYERECDVAFGYDPLSKPRMTLQQLAKGRLMVLAPPGAFDPARSGLTVEDLAPHDLIGVTSSGPIGTIVAGAQLGLREVVSVDTYYVAAGLVRHGVGVAIVDAFTASAMAATGVDCFPLVPALEFSVYAAWLEDRPVSKLANRFIAEVQATLVEALSLT